MVVGELVGGCRDGLIVRMQNAPEVLGMPVAFDGSVNWYRVSHVRADSVVVYRPTETRDARPAI